MLTRIVTLSLRVRAAACKSKTEQNEAIMSSFLEITLAWRHSDTEHKPLSCLTFVGKAGELAKKPICHCMS